MRNKKEPDIFEQLSIFQITDMLEDSENTFSSEDISKIIDKLYTVKQKKQAIEAKKRRQERKKDGNGKPVKRGAQRSTY